MAGNFEAESVFEAFQTTADRFPNRPFLQIVSDTAARYGIEARTFSYSDAASEISGLRDIYRGAGLGVGHRVALLLENRPAFFFHWIALNGLGVSVVPLNPAWRSAEIEYALGHSESSAVIALESRLDEVAAAARTVPQEIQVIPPDGSADLRGYSSSFGGEPDTGTECALLYTSGTTGRPKGCVLSNEYFLWGGEWYGQIGGLCALDPGGDRLLTPLPMYHMNAMANSTMVMLMTGGCIVPLDRFHPSSWWASVIESDASIVHYLGVMPAILLALPAAGEDTAHQVRFGFGAGVSAAHHEAFEARFGFPLIEAWAMTETGVGAAVIASQEPRKTGTACFGRPPPSLDWRIEDEDGRDVEAGDPGELLVRWRGDNPRFGFFSGYLKDPEATRQAWAGDYFHTGDLVYCDEEGDFHFVDRKKNVIRRSGENISAVEVEVALAEHSSVQAVAVAPVPDPVRGDEVLACVVRNPESASDDPAALAKDIVSHCLTRLAYFKAPGYVAFCDSLPLTPTEKVQRARLKELARDRLAAGECVDTRDMKRSSA